MTNIKKFLFIDIYKYCKCNILNEKCKKILNSPHFGFTLAEMMVVMLILSIIMAAMAPVMTTRNKLDQSSPWVWADNGSDAYYGLGDAQVAMIGQDKVSNTDTGARFIISAGDNKDHLLLKSNNNIVGRLRMVNKGILLGTTTTTPGSNSTGVGTDITVSGDTSTAYGYKSSATGAVSIALGSQSQSSEQASIAIGNKAKSSGMTSIAIGSTLPINNTSTTASGNNSIAIGNYSEATNTSSTAIGSQAKALEKNTSAIGAQSQANAEKATAIGFNAMAYGKYSVALGGFPTANEEGTIAIGNGTRAAETDGVAIGRYSSASGISAIAIGGSSSNSTSAQAQGSNSIAIGHNSTASGISSIALGGLSDNSTITSKSEGDYSIAIGHNSFASGLNSIALGASGHYAFSPRAQGSSSIAIGTWAIASESSSIAVGAQARSQGDNSIALGVGAQALGANSIALGDGAKAAGTNNIAIGANACTNATGANQVCIGAGSGPGKDDKDTIKSSSDKVIYLGTKDTTVYIPGSLIVGSWTVLGARSQDDRTTYPVYLRPGNKEFSAEWAVLGTYDYDGGDDNFFRAEKFGPLGPFGPFSWDTKINALSDRRLKYVGKESTSGLDKIKQLKVFNYTFKKDDKKTPHVGVIAQDLQKVFPDAVSKAKDGFLRIRFEDMFYAMINAIKELDAKYQAQEKRINELEKRIEKLEAQLK